MEKKIKSIGEHLPPVKLFLNDIIKLYEIFYAINNDVQLETENHILNSLDELSKIDEEKINNISYKISKPYVSLEMSKSSIWLYVNVDDYASKGIFNELKIYLLSKRRRHYKLIESPFTSGMLNGFLIVANLIYFKSIGLGLLATIALLLSFLYLKWVINRINNWHTIIYLSKNVKDFNFFQRKKDEIILILISSIFGALLGAFVTYLITN